MKHISAPHKEAMKKIRKEAKEKLLDFEVGLESLKATEQKKLDEVLYAWKRSVFNRFKRDPRF